MTAPIRPFVLALACLSCAPPCYDDGLYQRRGNVCQPGNPTGTDSVLDGATLDETTAADPGSDDGATCTPWEREWLLPLRTFLFVADCGENMNAPFDGSTRWEALTASLVGPGGVVTLREFSAQFGVVTFQGDAVCPDYSFQEPNLHASEEIETVLNLQTPGGTNPVGDAMFAANIVLRDFAVGPTTVVLLTGAEPSTCELPAPANAAELAITREHALFETKAARHAGYRTVVIGLGGDSDPEFLQTLANVGMGVEPGEPDAPFFVSHDDASLQEALATVTARSCSLPLTEMPVISTCLVEVADQPIAPSAENGWSIVGGLLMLRGTACDAVQADADVVVSLSCLC